MVYIYCFNENIKVFAPFYWKPWQVDNNFPKQIELVVHILTQFKKKDFNIPRAHHISLDSNQDFEKSRLFLETNLGLIFNGKSILAAKTWLGLNSADVQLRLQVQ